MAWISSTRFCSDSVIARNVGSLTLKYPMSQAFGISGAGTTGAALMFPQPLKAIIRTAQHIDFMACIAHLLLCLDSPLKPRVRVLKRLLSAAGRFDRRKQTPADQQQAADCGSDAGNLRPQRSEQRADHRKRQASTAPRPSAAVTAPALSQPFHAGLSAAQWLRTQ